MYFDILKELRYIDIIVLKEYDYRSEEYWNNENSFNDFLKSLNLDMDRYRFINEKLLRNGLLESSYDKEYKKFIESYLKLVESLKNPKKQLDRKVLRPSFKSRETLKLSKLGRAFIDFFANEEDSSNG